MKFIQELNLKYLMATMTYENTKISKEFKEIKNTLANLKKKGTLAISKNDEISLVKRFIKMLKSLQKYQKIYNKYFSKIAYRENLEDDQIFFELYINREQIENYVNEAEGLIIEIKALLVNIDINKMLVDEFNIDLLSK